MNQSRFMNGFNTTTLWISKFFFVNLLWLAFSLFGGLFLGIFPATASMFMIIRQWLNGNEDIPIFQTYRKFFKDDFLRTNLLGYSMVLLGFILYIDIRFILSINMSWAHFLLLPTLLISIIYLLLTIYIFPLYVHYEATNLQIIRNAFVMIFAHPVANIKAIFGVLAVYFIYQVIPGFLPFFGASLLAFICMWSVFDTVQRKCNA
nr:DUF624 domain-containing protein [Fredinandcohnia onubensis]